MCLLELNLTKKISFLLLTIFVISTQAYSKDYKFIGQDYEPFNWKEDGKMQGGMFEVVSAACLKMHENCSFDILPMKRVTKMLEEGMTDGVLSLIKNSDREKYSVLSTPIIKSAMSLHALKDSYPKKLKLKDFKKATVGVTSSSSAAKLVEKIKEDIGELSIVYETSLATTIKKLSAKRYGKTGLGMANEDVARVFMKKEGIKNIESIYDVELGNFGVAFSKKNIDPKFIEKFNRTIVAMKKSGEIKKILKPYGLAASN